MVEMVETRLDRTTINERSVADCRAAGEGLFIRTLERRLARKRITVPFVEYDLVAEMHGSPQTSLGVIAAAPREP